MKNVLIVDDSKTSQMIAKSCLEICGLTDTEFHFAFNGKEALEKVKEYPIDIAIVDLNMPVMNGVDLLKCLKSKIKTIYLPVVILSSIVNDKKRKDLIEIGAFHVLKKPISPAAIQPILDSF